MQPSLFEAVVRDALVVLVNSLWQGAAIAGLTWLALRLFPRTNASTRYIAWTFALVAVLVVPIATSLSHISSYEQQIVATRVSNSRGVSPHTTARVNAEERTVRSEPKHETASVAPYLQGTHPSIRINPPVILTVAFFGLWIALTLALVVRLIVALARLERLKTDAMPLGIEYRDQLVQWQRLRERDRDVRICVTDGIEVPVAVGLFDAMVLLPRHLLDEFDAAEIDQISLHELAHLLRHDDWTNGLQRVVSSLLFFNPAVWFIARQMDIEREVACDDYVLELTGSVRTYAFCLTKMAERTAWPHQPLAAPGVFTTRKNISIRIERLLRTGRAIGSSISPAGAAAVGVGLIAGYVLARVATPVVAFALPVPPALPQPVAIATPKAVTPKPPRVVAQTTQSTWTRPEVTFTTKPLTVTVPATKVDVPQMSFTVPGVAVSVPHVHVHVADMRPGMNCSGCDFENQNLAGKSFAGSNMSGTDFSHSNLQGADFSGANLSGSDFEDADLRNASFVGANLTGANLDHAKLDGANLDRANLSGAEIDARALSPAQIRAYLPHCRGCDLSGADLGGMDLSGVHLIGVDLSKANLRGANLSHAVFSGVDFSGADLRGARTDGTQFIGCDFSGAQLGNP